MPGEPVTRSELRASLSELELKLRIWADERFNATSSKDQIQSVEKRFEDWCTRLEIKPLDELKVREIARQAIEKDQTDAFTGKSRIITLVLFVGSVATTITTLIVFFINAT